MVNNLPDSIVIGVIPVAIAGCNIIHLDDVDDISQEVELPFSTYQVHH